MTRPHVQPHAWSVICSLAAAVGLFGPAAAAGRPEHWTATSTTASSITGDVTFTPAEIRFQNGRSLRLSLVGRVPGFTDMDDVVDAAVYRVTTPADPVLINGNRLCGGGSHSRPVTYIAVWSPHPMPGDTAPRSMAAFSGTRPPTSSGGDGSCGIYNYESGH